MNSRWVAVALVGTGVVVTWLLRELLYGILIDGVSINAFGIAVFGAWSVVVVVGVVAITRARDADADFRGVFSELLRIASMALLLLVIATMVMMTVTRPFEWEKSNEGCIQRGNFTRCVIPLRPR